jgi:hypothetical protein
MSALPRTPCYRTALLAAVSIFFCITSGLTFYSGNRIAATVGDRYPSMVEQLAFWVGLVAQPWVFVAAWIDSAFGFHVLYASIASTVTTSLVSASVLFFVLRALFRLWSGWLLPTSACLSILAGISVYTFNIDTRIVDEANSSYEGP